MLLGQYSDLQKQFQQLQYLNGDKEDIEHVRFLDEMASVLIEQDLTNLSVEENSLKRIQQLFRHSAAANLLAKNKQKIFDTLEMYVLLLRKLKANTQPFNTRLAGFCTYLQYLSTILTDWSSINVEQDVFLEITKKLIHTLKKIQSVELPFLNSEMLLGKISTLYSLVAMFYQRKKDFAAFGYYLENSANAASTSKMFKKELLLGNYYDLYLHYKSVNNIEYALFYCVKLISAYQQVDDRLFTPDAVKEFMANLYLFVEMLKAKELYKEAYKIFKNNTNFFVKRLIPVLQSPDEMTKFIACYTGITVAILSRLDKEISIYPEQFFVLDKKQKAITTQVLAFNSSAPFHNYRKDIDFEFDFSTKVIVIHDVLDISEKRLSNLLKLIYQYNQERLKAETTKEELKNKANTEFKEDKEDKEDSKSKEENNNKNQAKKDEDNQPPHHQRNQPKKTNKKENHSENKSEDHLVQEFKLAVQIKPFNQENFEFLSKEQNYELFGDEFIHEQIVCIYNDTTVPRGNMFAFFKAHIPSVNKSNISDDVIDQNKKIAYRGLITNGISGSGIKRVRLNGTIQERCPDTINDDNNNNQKSKPIEIDYTYKTKISSMNFRFWAQFLKSKTVAVTDSHSKNVFLFQFSVPIPHGEEQNAINILNKAWKTPG